MNDVHDYRPVLRHYAADCQPRAARFLNSVGGFSGARLWRLVTPRGPLCLRRWPGEQPTPDRLEFIQAVLWHVDQEGFDRVPLPLETIAHRGYVRHEGHLWELTPWLPGRPDYVAAPSSARLGAAMAALAEFHRAAGSFPLPDAALCASPGIAERRGQLADLDAGGYEQLRRAVALSVEGSMLAVYSKPAARILGFFLRAAPRIRAELDEAARARVPIQPCLRDIWHENVLFVGDEVSGLVDFGAMRPENVAADVARLLGSLAEDDAAGWREGLAAYEQIRPLSEVEATLVRVFDSSGVLLGGMNWIRWIYEEHRQFGEAAAVAKRLDYFCRRLARKVESQ
jgi:homoserine kinase type II